MASRGVNKVILVGRLGNDPEVKHMPNGRAVVNFSLATSDQWKDKNSGERQERTEWHRVVAFERLAEIIGEYLKKGSNIYCEGKLQTRKWQGKDGNDIYSTEVVIKEMQMLDGKSDSQGGQGGYQQQQRQPQQQAQQQKQQANTMPDDFEDDIPF